MPVDRLPARITDKGQHQQPGQGQSFGITKLAETDGHAFVAFCRLIAIGAEQTIPPRQVKPAD